jgi:hypothetical protein
MNKAKTIFLLCFFLLDLPSCCVQCKDENSATKSQVLTETVISNTDNQGTWSVMGDELSQSYKFINKNCIKSYQDFAYYLANWDRDRIDERIGPLPPWQIENTIPVDSDKAYHDFQKGVELSRSYENDEEIWVSVMRLANLKKKTDQHIFFIYQVKAQQWKEVSGDLDYKGVYVSDLFVTSDGDVWGATKWDSTQVDSSLERIPILSRYDEINQRFEFAVGVKEIPVVRDINFANWPNIVLDKQDRFWIFLDNDGIYRYDPKSQNAEIETHTPDFNFSYAVLSPDGGIFFERSDPEVYTSKEKFMRLSDSMLYQFSPQTTTIDSIEIPIEPWPLFSGLLIDHQGRLWLGANGYRDTDGSWKLILPNIDEYFQHLGDVSWATPHLMLESSDGLLWYQKYLDQGTLTDGTAWYNPITGEGCVFMNQAANVIEDSNHTLWLAVDTNLFKYELK